jgi:hypothetical protein
VVCYSFLMMTCGPAGMRRAAPITCVASRDSEDASLARVQTGVSQAGTTTCLAKHVHMMSLV